MMVKRELTPFAYAQEDEEEVDELESSVESVVKPRSTAGYEQPEVGDHSYAGHPSPLDKVGAKQFMRRWKRARAGSSPPPAPEPLSDITFFDGARDGSGNFGPSYRIELPPAGGWPVVSGEQCDYSTIGTRRTSQTFFFDGFSRHLPLHTIVLYSDDTPEGIWPEGPLRSHLDHLRSRITPIQLQGVASYRHPSAQAYSHLRVAPADSVPGFLVTLSPAEIRTLRDFEGTDDPAVAANVRIQRRKYRIRLTHLSPESFLYFWAHVRSDVALRDPAIEFTYETDERSEDARWTYFTRMFKDLMRRTIELQKKQPIARVPVADEDGEPGPGGRRSVTRKEMKKYARKDRLRLQAAGQLA